MTEIIKGAPMPSFENKRKSKKYPTEKMEVGDYIVVYGQSANAYAIALNASKIHAPAKFRAQILNDGQNRIWRVA